MWLQHNLRFHPISWKKNPTNEQAPQVFRRGSMDWFFIVVLYMRISHQCMAYMDCKWMDESIEFMTNGFKTTMDLQLDRKQQWVAFK